MKKSMTVVYAALLGAYVGISLPLPLLGPMILGDESPFLLAGDARYVYLSLLLAAFPLGNVMGAPMMGSLSDRFGRKKVLLAGLSGGALFYALSGAAIAQGNIFLLLSSRFLSGIFEGNAAIAQSFIAHNVEAKDKVRMFGIMVAVMSVGYALGPLVGGVFSNKQLVPWASLALPFYCVALFVVVTLIGVVFFFERDQVAAVASSRFVDGIRELFTMKILMRLLVLTFVYAIGRSLCVDFLASFLNMRFGLAGHQTSWIWVLIATVWGIAALGAGLGSRVMSNHTKLVLAMVLAGITEIFMAMSTTMEAFITLSTVMVIGLALVGTINTVIVSDAAPKAHMGLAMGLLSSMYLLGEVTACLVGGWLLHIREHVPFVVSGIVLCIAALGFMQFFIHKASVICAESQRP